MLNIMLVCTQGTLVLVVVVVEVGAHGTCTAPVYVVTVPRTIGPFRGLGLALDGTPRHLSKHTNVSRNGKRNRKPFSLTDRTNGRAEVADADEGVV